jgi:hypothetical protein
MAERLCMRLCEHVQVKIYRRAIDFCLSADVCVYVVVVLGEGAAAWKTQPMSRTSFRATNTHRKGAFQPFGYLLPLAKITNCVRVCFTRVENVCELNQPETMT